MNDTSTAQATPTATKSGGSMRLLVLLGLLAVMVGALAYDRLVAGPGKEKAKDRIDEMVTSKSGAGIQQGVSAKDKGKHLPTDADVRQAIGFPPKWTKKDGDYTLQCFHWWGWIPLNRNYLVVQYTGDNPLIFVKYTDGQMPTEPPIKVDSNAMPTTIGGPPPGAPTQPPGADDKPAATKDDAADEASKTADPDGDKKPADTKAKDDAPAATEDAPAATEEK